MKRLCQLVVVILTLLGMASAQEGNNQANIGGLLIASNFTQWTVPQGNQGGYSWSSPDFCKVNFAGTTFNAFATGTPVQIVDTGNPTNSEVVTVQRFNSQVNGCSIQVSPTHVHNTFFFRSATGGLGEAMSFAGQQLYQVLLTPDWTKLGGNTGLITSQAGNANVTILDQRTAIILPYIWSGSAYVSQPFAGGGGPPTGAAGGALAGFYPNPGLAAAVAIPTGWTAVTQSPGDNSTKISTTAYADAAVAAGGARFPGTNNVVYNTSPTASRNATSDDISTLYGYTPLAPSYFSTLPGCGTSGFVFTPAGTNCVSPGAAPTGSAGGALGGTYPNPTFPAQALANGMTATTQSPGDSTTKVSTDGFVAAAIAGISGLLPSAPGYGYAPISTGAGSVYSPQTVILGFGSNGVQYVQQPLGSGFFPSLNVNSFGNVFYADGFSSYGGVGQAVVAWASGPNYKQCQVVSNSGLFYVNLNAGTSGSVTPGTNTGVWYPVPNNLPATAPDCAFYTADSYTRSQNKGSLVQFGNGTYTANQGWIEQTTGSSFGDEFGVSLGGSGQGVTYLAYAGTAGIPFISRPNGAANFASIHIYDMTIDAGGLASSVWDLDTLNQSYFFNLSIGHVAPGSDHVAMFAHTGGFGFQVFAKNINVGVFPDQNFPNCAQVSASGTTTIAFTVTNGGSCYATPSSSRVAHVQLRGTRAGTAAFPCTVMPTSGGVPAFSGSALASISSMTGGTGCVGPYYVQVYESVPVNYGIVFNNSDSSAEDITSYVGDTAAFIVNAGNFVGTHLHPSVVPNGIIWNASGALIGTEIDDVFDKAFTLNQPFSTTGVSITGTNGYVGCGGTSRINAGATMYYFAATTVNANIGDSASLFDGGGSNSTCNAGWTPFLTQSGPITSPSDMLSKAPTGFSVTGQDKSLTQTAAIGDYIPILTVNTFSASALKGNTVNGLASGVATSGANFSSAGSPGFGPQASTWNGSGAITSTAIEQLNAGSGTNPTLQAQLSIFPCPSTCTWLFNQQVLVQNLLDAYHFGSNTPSGPTVAAGTGAGTSPTGPAVVSFGTDLSGYVTLTTGTTPTASAVVFTLTFNQAYLFNGPKCTLWPSNAAAQALVGVAGVQFLRADLTTTTAAARVGSTALAAATAYEWGYTCTQ